MTTIILLAVICLFLLYFLYDQFAMDRLQGKNLLKVRLKKQKRTKADALIFVGLAAILLYQSAVNFDKVSVYLLSALIVLAIYGAFFRTPVLLLKTTGFFYANIFIRYNQIHAINLSQDNILVVDLTNGKRLLILIESAVDFEKVFAVWTELGVISKDSRQTLNQILGEQQ